jgi:PAS domain S-box-containing protein
MHPEYSSGRETRMQQWTPSGLRAVPHLAWGSHLAHIFASGDELRDVMVPFFKAGLDNNERCFWLTGKAFNADDARAALRVAVPDLDKRERDKQIEIANGDAWYASGTMPRPQDLIDRLLERGEDALTDGYAGLRTSGNCAWVAKEQWADFVEYERLVHAFTRGRPMICMCSYCVDQIGDNADLDVMSNHDMVIPVRRSAGTLRNDIREAQPTPSPSSLIATIAGVAQDVLDALPIGFYVCDASGQIVRVNRKAVELWGRAPRLRDTTERFCGTFRLESLDRRNIPPDATPMSRAVLYGESFKGVEAIVHNPDGKRWIARVDIEPLREADGTLVGAANCFQDVTQEHELRRTLEGQQRTFDLAMVASQMGTWRYTLADNICVYDENAQRLYGLTEERFLHDEAGVKAKFHPDDMDLMWSRVEQALDPQGDGRYDVEYRVKQLDGSWRWLSAWGLVEFEGDGADRKPVAIAGASRDLTERKQAEELQRLLLNELNHRVKNTLATVQAIAWQTLQTARDLPTAREALDRRIRSMAQAHDLLTSRAWTGASLMDVVTRTLEAFPPAQVDLSGRAVELPPKHALALSMALHELATNATKYGALSRTEGRVTVQWRVQDDLLHLVWQESEGPAVVAPVRKGFGSRLLEDFLVRDLGGATKLAYDPAGVRCTITARL